ncbi:kinase-like domain-containing protein [Irpex lacteus]|nr:kinase-like domain-containing protein [Irpex lacteus]
MDPYFSATVKTEYEILKAISHPNVVAMVEGFREPGSFMIVLEFAKYGDLLGFSQIYALDEKLVANIAGQMLEGIYHLHLQNIAHIDIKPMNVLVFCKSPCIVKISDFGLALPCEPGNGIVGTPAYQAPEASVGLRWHAAKLDAFSLGASFFQLLAPDRGVPCRFARGVQGELLQPLQRLPICWERLPELLTSAGRTLLQGLLDYEPKGRTGVAEALGHPWIKWGKS